jgi:hypothetical protein
MDSPASSSVTSSVPRPVSAIPGTTGGVIKGTPSQVRSVTIPLSSIFLRPVRAFKMRARALCCELGLLRAWPGGRARGLDCGLKPKTRPALALFFFCFPHCL